MRKIVFFMMSLFLCSMILPIAYAGVDQSQTDSDYVGDINHANRWAQTFQPTVGVLTGISIGVSKSSHTPADDLTVTLKKGGPDGTTVYTWTVSHSSVLTYDAYRSEPHWLRLNCSGALNLDLGSQYSIVLTSPGSSDTAPYIVDWYVGSNKYAYGDAYKRYIWWPWPETWTSWEVQTGDDLAFKTWIPNVDPDADFSYTKIYPLTYTFDGSLSSDPDGSIVQYEWDWDDDGTYDQTGEQPTYTFSSYGSYRIRLRVTDDEDGTDVTSKWVYISNTQPVAAISYTYTNLTLYVDGAESYDSDGSIVSYKWDWDSSNGVDWDDPDDTGMIQSHTYPSNGTYTFTLQVTDDLGATDTDSITQTFTLGSSGGGESEEDDTGSSGFFDNDWIQFFLNLPTFVIIVIIAIAFIMVAATSFFMKPEIISSVGVVPAVSSLILGITSIIALIVWYAELETYYVLICIVIIISVLALDFKYFFGRKRR